jgi:hypothetical protein
MREGRQKVVTRGRGYGSHRRWVGGGLRYGSKPAQHRQQPPARHDARNDGKAPNTRAD